MDNARKKLFVARGEDVPLHARCVLHSCLLHFSVADSFLDKFAAFVDGFDASPLPNLDLKSV